MLDHPSFAPYRTPIGQLMRSVSKFYMDKTHNILRDRLPCYEALKDYEAPRIKRYEPNEGVFDWHFDAADQQSSKRAIVMFWYLNDVKEGGETLFDSKSVKLSATYYCTVSRPYAFFCTVSYFCSNVSQYKISKVWS